MNIIDGSIRQLKECENPGENEILLSAEEALLLQQKDAFRRMEELGKHRTKALQDWHKMKKKARAKNKAAHKARKANRK